MSSPNAQVPGSRGNTPASPTPHPTHLSGHRPDTGSTPLIPPWGGKLMTRPQIPSQAAATTTTSNVDVLSVSHEGDASQSATAVEVCPGWLRGRDPKPRQRRPRSSPRWSMDRDPKPSSVAS
ncbi:hypothetical protein GWK47_053196 [Chionoecetes opilio]|uniref:Uncharacterized protein n=1 Tax=Chionoecetes opilio TaxID=41210 RepID=A0A8J4Y6C9_CHIOP|nr:hypothetical protein GWK47_053196 [Chionoecetes opilio]